MPVRSPSAVRNARVVTAAAIAALGLVPVASAAAATVTAETAETAAAAATAAGAPAARFTAAASAPSIEATMTDGVRDAEPLVPRVAITVGEPFPELVLPTLDGTPMSLASLRGHRAMLHVFASW